MGVKFSQWLAKPSTIHFLRHLLKAQGVRVHSSSPSKRLAHSDASVRYVKPYGRYARSDQDNEERENCEKDDSDDKITRGLSELATSLRGRPLDVASLNLQMSLAGVVVLNRDVYASDWYMRVRYHANVNSTHIFGKLLVDDPANKYNYELWAEILQFRQRLDGVDGVIDVWEGMRKRDIDLPVQGDEADVMWQTFTRAIFSIWEGEKVSFLEEVVAYAEDLKRRTGSHYAGLYKGIVGGHLRANSSKLIRHAQTWSNRLADAGYQSREDVARIVEDAVFSTKRKKALMCLKTIYLRSGHRDLYDACISEALKCNDVGAALTLHELFLQQGDAPSAAMLDTPGVQRLIELDKNKSLPIQTPSTVAQTHPITHEAVAPDTKASPIGESSLHTIIGGLPGMKSKQLSDHFCARLVATRAFSLDFVIQVLSMFGVERIGPLVVRELAIRAGSPAWLRKRISDIEAQGMTLNGHVYCRLASKVANEDITNVWDVLLASDQHPESYADIDTQKALLAMFLEKHQWAEAHLSLLVLSLSGPHGSVEGWNVLLQHYIQHYEYRPMLSAFKSMQSQNLPLSQKTIKDIYWHVLPERQPGKRYIKGRAPQFFDPLNFSVNAIMYGSERGSFVRSTYWIELLKRFGMNHDWNNLERLVLWLVDHYSFDKSAHLLGLSKDSYLHRKRVFRRMVALRHIFNPTMCKALLVWGFRSASVRWQGVENRLEMMNLEQTGTDVHDPKSIEGPHEPWAQGLALLKTLDSKTRISPLGDAREAFKLRMWILFGPGYSTLGINNEARRENRLSLTHYLKHANRIWPGIILVHSTSLSLVDSDESV